MENLGHLIQDPEDYRVSRTAETDKAKATTSIRELTEEEKKARAATNTN